MFLTVQEMTTLCALHAGTVSETLAVLRTALEQKDTQPPERKAIITKLVQVLSDMKDGDAVSLAFEPES